MPTASDVYTESRSFLNDTGIQIYTNTVLLPYLKTAHDELVQRLRLRGAKVLYERSAVVNYTANDLVIALPADLLTPLSLEEKPDGAADSQYRAMIELQWEIDTPVNDRLIYWAYREQEIKVLPATTARDVRIKYIKAIPEISGDSSDITVLQAKTFLSAKTAEHAYRFIAKNMIMADSCANKSEVAIAVLLDNITKTQVNQTARMKPFGFSQKMRRILWR